MRYLIIFIFILAGCASPQTVCERESKRGNEYYHNTNCLEIQQRKITGLGIIMNGIGKGLQSSGENSSFNEVESGPKTCSFSSDCSVGEKCLKGNQGSQLYGVCGVAVDSQGFRTYDNEKVTSCSFNTDCSIGFYCYKTNGLYGVCLKK